MPRASRSTKKPTNSRHATAAIERDRLDLIRKSFERIVEVAEAARLLAFPQRPFPMPEAMKLRHTLQNKPGEGDRLALARAHLWRWLEESADVAAKSRAALDPIRETLAALRVAAGLGSFSVGDRVAASSSALAVSLIDEIAGDTRAAIEFVRRQRSLTLEALEKAFADEDPAFLDALPQSVPRENTAIFWPGVASVLDVEWVWLLKEAPRVSAGLEGESAHLEKAAPSIERYGGARVRSDRNKATGLMTAEQIAAQAGVPIEALRARLRRHFTKDKSIRHEVPDRRPRDPWYTWRLDAVQPDIDDLKASVERRSNVGRKKI